MSRTTDHVVLVGLMASGKSEVGRRVAERLGRSLLDSDVEIARTTGRTVRELAAEIGPDAMHDLEERQLLDALARREPVVVAAAASTIEREACRDALRAEGVFVVWLRVPVPLLVARFHSAGHRPTFDRPVDELLADQMARRGPLFEQVADVRMQVDAGATPDALATALLWALEDA